MSRIRWSLLIGCAIAALFFAVYPRYVIRPFRAQDPNALALAMACFRMAPIATAICAVIALGAVIFGARKFAGTALLVLTVACAAAARVNIFELMFHPVPDVRFIAPAQASIDANDMVMAVSLGGESHAYPVREMGYHHIVNDRLHGLPVVVTY